MELLPPASGTMMFSKVVFSGISLMRRVGFLAKIDRTNRTRPAHVPALRDPSLEELFESLLRETPPGRCDGMGSVSLTRALPSFMP